MLDKTKPYGYVQGMPGIQYEQDNKYYNGQGKEVDDSGKLIEEEKAKKTTQKSAGKT